jgi:hypothetical protein
MDLFGWSNMFDASARVEVSPWTDGTVGVEYRHARLAKGSGEWIGSYLSAIGSANVPPSVPTAPAPPAASVADDTLGNELDVGVTWRPWLPLELRAGWSGLLLGDGAKAIMVAHARGKTEPNGTISPPDLAQYAYLQATLTMP